MTIDYLSARIWQLEQRLIPDFNIQRFAAEDEGRTEDPTERRKREEREKGNVAKSQDIVSAAVLIGTVVTLFFMSTYIYNSITSMLVRYLGGDYSYLQNLQKEDIRRLIFQLFWECARVTGPVLAAAVLMAVIANVAQVGALFTLQPLAFKPERMIPDFKRVLPNRRTLFNLGKILVQVIFIAGIAGMIVVNDFIPMLSSGNMALNQAIGLFAWISFKMLLACSLTLFLFAIPDYYFQRYEYIEKLKMTTSETKRERKDEEGDPLVRQRQRDRGLELRQRRNMLKEVPKADVVITNPTHYAIALEYNPELNTAPIVLAKGADNLAFLIRTIARENEIPIQENPYLARILYQEVGIGQEIPANLFQAVSVIFASLDRFNKSGSATGVS